MEKIFVINPGATSTKIAYFDGKEKIKAKIIRHNLATLSKFERIWDQLEFRKEIILEFLKSNNIDLSNFSAVVGRGGVIKPIPSGTYVINEKMIKDCKNSPVKHPCNLGPVLAFEIANTYKIPAFTVDPPIVDERIDLARISGLKEIERKSRFHALNLRMIAIERAEKKGGNISDFNFIAVHLGGGISVASFMKGKIIDANDASEEGPFSPDRAGGVPSIALVDMCFAGNYTKDEIKKKLFSKGGLAGYLGTNNIQEVEKRIEGGDAYAQLVFEAMAYQVAKEIGISAAVLKGQVDEILVSGGAANSERFVNLIKERVSFIAPVKVYPGERELEALCFVALRVLRKEEEVKLYESV